jgi:oligopeptide/dipeptide ABC transporter ATP-binding protein
VDQLLQEVGLDPLAGNRYPHQFSGGQRQRVGIARALALNPELVICDECVSALDVSVQAQVLNLLRDLQAAHGLTYLFIAHDLSVVEFIADRILVMYLGRIVEDAPKRALLAGRLHPYTQALFEASPVLDPDLRGRQLTVAGDPPSPIDPPAGCHFHPRCPYATELCRERYPERKEVAPGHFTSCHRYQGVVYP